MTFKFMKTCSESRCPGGSCEVTSGEVAASIFRGLGLDIHKDLPGPQNRPIPLVEYSLSAIKELF